MKILNDVNVNNTTRGFKWAMNTDGAEIFFKNDSDGDSDSYLGFRTFDNGNEYFKWDHRTNAGTTEWMNLRSSGLTISGAIRANGNTVLGNNMLLDQGGIQVINAAPSVNIIGGLAKYTRLESKDPLRVKIGTDNTEHYVYHSGYKPSPADIGAVNKAGDTMTGRLKITANNNTLDMGSMNTSYCHFASSANIPFHFNRDVRIAGEIYAGASYNQRVYHTGYKPSWGDIQSKHEGIYIGTNSTLSFQEEGGFNKTRSGFKRHNGAGGVSGGLALHVAHPNFNNGAHSRGIAFDYGSGGSRLYTYGYDANGNKSFEHEMWHAGNFNPASKANTHDHPYIPTNASCNKNWHWSGQGGQPSWLWGGNDGTNMYVYNPSNFSVNNSDKIKGKNIFVQTGQPSAQNTGDVWISW